MPETSLQTYHHAPDEMARSSHAAMGHQMHGTTERVTVSSRLSNTANLAVRAIQRFPI